MDPLEFGALEDAPLKFCCSMDPQPRKSQMDDTAKKTRLKQHTIEKLDFQKIKHENKGFTTYLNIVIQNIPCPIALGIWCYLSSLPHDWSINKNQLKNHFHVGRDKLDKALAILKKLDLLQFIREREANGTLSDTVILIKVGYEFNQTTENQCSGTKGRPIRVSSRTLKNQALENQATGKRHLQKKQNTNKIKKQKKERKSIPLPDNFYPNEEAFNFMNEYGFTQREAKMSFLKFKEYYKNDLSPDWDRKLILWLLREYAYKKETKK